MLLTTTPAIEDHTIREYKGVVFGEVITGVNFLSWLFAIAHNTFLNHRKATRTYESLEEAKMVIDKQEADSYYIHEDLYLALSTLPPKERSAVTLYYLTGYSVKEIATISNSTEDAVKKQLSRGRDKLKSRLKR